MNKGELVAALAEKTNLNKKDSEAVLNALIDVIGETILGMRECADAIGLAGTEAPSAE